MLAVAFGVVAGLSRQGAILHPARTASATRSPGRPVPQRQRPTLRHAAFNVYAADRANALSSVVRSFPERVYVPKRQGTRSPVIDPSKRRIIGSFPVGALLQHVTPTYDLRRRA